MADVCVIVEGTYPFVSGGVSSWVHQLISNMPNISFSILHIGAKKDPFAVAKYAPLANIVEMKEIYIHANQYSGIPHMKPSTIPWEHSLKEFHDDLKNSNEVPFHKIFELFADAQEKSLGMTEMLFSKKSWAILVDLFTKRAPLQSFVDYFWTWRYTHLPIMKLMTASIPKAEVYHPVSTGYAGLAAVLAHFRYGAPFILTEHGIYTKERKIELQSADWIYRNADVIQKKEDRDYFKNIWIRMFSFLGKIAYRYADQVVTLHEGNRQIEIAEGAHPDKVRVIPNGLFSKSYTQQRKAYLEREKGNPYVIGLVGRVVPIKDIKTFIRSIRIVHESVKNFKALIMGGTDEDPEYYKECVSLVSLLHLEEVIEFTGMVKMSEYYPKVDLIVLTSISEAQPLVILEGHCVGVPVVATNVGACKERLEGRADEEPPLGASGFIAQIANPPEIAAAMVKLLKDDTLRETMGLNGLKRVEKYYRQEELLAEYATYYHNLRLKNKKAKLTTEKIHS